ncbi:Murein DD-endopeptidase MepM [Saezia sanguinis]|uniref:Murein DD-endopeptidase MepM n=2 Tax=Saezia sanguinis TaxID=1965230 RepID=A0A433SAD7_9BURK|nr:Murein DD-endopeptidase MepM [Saezia sanguinis]
MADWLSLPRAVKNLVLDGVVGSFKRHPRVTLLGASLLVCGSAMAALSVSPATDEAASVHVTAIERVLPVESELAQQADLLGEHQYSLYRDGYTRSSDTIQALFGRLGIDDAQALEFMRKDPLARLIMSSNRDVRVMAEVGQQGELVRLQAGLRSQTARHFNRITIQRNEEGNLTSVSETVPVEVRERVAMGTIKYSLYGATDAIGLPDNIAIQMVDIFGSRIDFTRHLRRGDTFQLVYESYEADGVPMGTGRILGAQFINGGRNYNAVWFQPDESVRGTYYTFDGKSLRTTFLAYPLEYTRVSSAFGRRLHPIQNTWRDHKGIDYAAPTGTTVRTVGDGRIEFAGVQRGYGNVVIVSHDKTRSTLYAHMSRIDVTKGQLVQQGDPIGAVGQTGWATGPHLHFEFKENGVQRDPAILAAQTEAQPIPENLQAEFDRTAQIHADLLGRVAELMVVRSTDTEVASR